MEINNQQYGSNSRGQNTSHVSMGISSPSKRRHLNAGTSSHSARTSFAKSGLSFKGVIDSLKNPQHAIVGESAKEEYMSSFTREELDAKLGQNKAEVGSVAAAMRQEMAEWREQQNQQIFQLTNAISTLSSKIDGKMDSIDGVVKSFDGKVEGIQGRIDGMGTAIGGINTAITGIQSGMSTKLTVFGIIITVVIALVGFGASFFGKPSEPQTHQDSPIVIQLPQQSDLPKIEVKPLPQPQK